MIKEILYKLFKIEEVCNSCETLKEQLEIANAEKRMLLDKLVQPKEIVREVITNEEPQPIIPRTVPWHIKREMLENNDRKTAQMKKQREEEIRLNSIDKLEKELLDEIPIDATGTDNIS